MELIYSNEKHEDIGVLSDCTFDLAFGRSENNFEVEMALANHCMKQGYFVFVEGTEYGGVVDSIRVNVDSDTVTYSGRTWHGILAGNIIEPDKGYDHLTVSGDANEILALLIKRLGLEDLFEASTVESPIKITRHQIRYKDGYSGICDMLAEYDGKLQMIHLYDKIILSAVYLMDFSQDEEFDSTQVDLDIQKNFRPVNHLVCLGSGDLKDRHVIHLFADAGGGILPYTTSDNPVEDADYILDVSQQILNGVDEVAAVYSYPQAETTINHTLLSEQPSDWAENFGNYWKRDADGLYIAAEGEYEDRYTPVLEQPENWEEVYGDYFALSDGEYRSAASVKNAVYTRMTVEPDDWGTNYGSYYVRSSDGVEYKYTKVGSAQTAVYKAHTMKPTDWETNFKKYYTRNTKMIYKEQMQPVTQDVYDRLAKREAEGKLTWGENGQHLGFQSVTIYQENTEDYNWIIPYVTPPERPADWDTNWGSYYYASSKLTGVESSFSPVTTYTDWVYGKFYTKYSKSVAPEWSPRSYYRVDYVTGAPEFKSGEFFSHERVLHKPPFVADTYFRKTYDHFKELVKGGLEQFKSLVAGDSVKVNLDLEGEYDIGDIVGAHEQTTGVSVWKPITKKIVSFKDGQTSINYEIGGS